MELSTGAAQLTVEAACDHLQHFEVRQSAPFRRDFTSELVGDFPVVAKIEYLE